MLRLTREQLTKTELVPSLLRQVERTDGIFQGHGEGNGWLQRTEMIAADEVARGPKPGEPWKSEATPKAWWTG